MKIFSNVCKFSLLGGAVVLFILTATSLRLMASENFAGAVEALHKAEGQNAVKILEVLIKKGDVQAEALLGEILLDGIYFKENHARANSLLVSAASKKVPQAMFRVASSCMLFGKKNTCNTQYLIDAAESGHPFAQYILGNHFLYGEYLEKDWKKARYWFHQAFQNKFPIAQEMIVLMKFPLLFSGQNLKDYQRFFDEIALTSDLGFRKSQFYLGRLNFYGLGTQKNIREALKWFLLASYQNSKSAKEYVKKIYDKYEFKDSTALDWLSVNAQNDQSYFGISARWCVAEMGSDIECLKNAIPDHASCLPPFFSGYFSRFISSNGYSFCRSRFFSN